MPFTLRFLFHTKSIPFTFPFPSVSFDFYLYLNLLFFIRFFTFIYDCFCFWNEFFDRFLLLRSLLWCGCVWMDEWRDETDVENDHQTIILDSFWPRTFFFVCRCYVFRICAGSPASIEVLLLLYKFSDCKSMCRQQMHAHTHKCNTFTQMLSRTDTFFSSLDTRLKWVSRQTKMWAWLHFSFIYPFNLIL